MSKCIYLDAPNIGKSEKEYLSQAIDRGYVSTVGPYVPKFENEIADYLGVKSAVSTQSGTAAIHMALYELGIGKGDEIIVPALTFIATVNPVIYVGARPVFVDVDIKTWNIDPGEIEKAITKRTKAIIPVHFYGNPCDMARIMKIAKKHNLHVIEDAAESLGAKYKNRPTGTFGDLGCFSFNGNKVITTGGGGMVASNDTDKIGHIKFLVNQARNESRGFYHPEVGFNYRMTNIEAALGLAQMKKLENFLAKKRTFNAIYRKALGDSGFIKFQEVDKKSESSYWFTTVTIENGMDIANLQKRLKEKGVPTRRVYMPLIEFPPYKTYKDGECRNSYRIYDRGLCLPSSTLNSESDIRYVCRRIKEIL